VTNRTPSLVGEVNQIQNWNGNAQFWGGWGDETTYRVVFLVVDLCRDGYRPGRIAADRSSDAAAMRRGRHLLSEHVPVGILSGPLANVARGRVSAGADQRRANACRGATREPRTRTLGNSTAGA